ncbi:DUF1622 domain-containing protein [Allofustis seminis]|uniref:DUF1622 domain-containing protein n=1 Tax=Allofustis seminis TaxID=166939 RepID=UPI000362CC53|nr:DUF1622 domain-containing protein [Allofustis seminis]
MEAALEEILYISSYIAIHVLEIIGIAIIVYAAVETLLLLFKSRLNYSDRDVLINFGEALSLSLTFNLGAEIIKTVTVRDTYELVVLSAVVIIRIIITVLLHWELKQVADEGHGDARKIVHDNIRGLKDSFKKHETETPKN